jgi:pimeloyl-ACP methyl ester carboxylesterase
MATKGRDHIQDLRGASRLAVEATRGVTALVEAVHLRIAGGPDILGRPLAGPIGALSGLVYGSIRGVTTLVGMGIDAALAPLGPLIGRSAPGAQREAVLAALNGVLGDYLDATGNPLAIQMRLRRDGHPLELTRQELNAALPAAGSKLLVFVHGSSMSDLQWRRHGRDFAGALAQQLGYTAIFLHYNSGLHVSTNGRAFAALLETAFEQWPAPLDEIAIVGHSMGGLVTRSACHAAVVAGHRWMAKLRKLVFLGTPHHGAALERYGSWVDAALGISSYSAPFARLGKIRSAGVTDLRFGNVLDEDWEGRDRFQLGRDARRPLPLPDGVECFAMAARADALVSVDSALGRHARPELTLAFPAAHQWVAAVTHLDLLGHPEVYEVLERWLSRG